MGNICSPGFSINHRWANNFFSQNQWKTLIRIAITLAVSATAKLGRKSRKKLPPTLVFSALISDKIALGQ